MKLLDDLKALLKGKDVNPWDLSEKPKVTDEERQEAIEEMKKPKPKFPWWKANAAGIIIWGIINFVLLFGMAGSPVAGGILFYVLVNLAIYIHYFILLRRTHL